MLPCVARVFCSTHFRWDNQPIDVRAQQDTSEFFFRLNEQLEGTLLLWLSFPSGFRVVFEKPNRSSFTFPFTACLSRACFQEAACYHDGVRPMKLCGLAVVLCRV